MGGILVHGDNHFIVRGPCPDRVAALALAWNWSVIRKENLEWAIVAPAEGETTAAVAELLDELRAVGIEVQAV